jgi:predicted nucleic acid-binding protein
LTGFLLDTNVISEAIRPKPYANWEELAGRAVLRGAPMPVLEGLLAATAVHHNLTLVTRDTRHPEAAGKPLFNPWEA